MPRLAEKMTDKRLKALTKETACGVVPGLIVTVRKRADGSLGKYFVLRYQSNGKTAKYNLGAYPQMSLAQAFEKAKAWREQLDAGIDPAEGLKKQKDEKIFKSGITLEDLIWQWVDFEAKRGLWDMSAKKTKEDFWLGWFKQHFTDELKRMPAVKVTPKILADAFGEKWVSMVDTPERILSDMARAYAWGIRQGILPAIDNPAKVNGGILGDLLPHKRPTGSHRPSLPVARMPDFFAALVDSVPTSQAARCLAFAILTAARNSTAREATWDEMHFEAKIPHQLVPRKRMKVKTEKLPFDRKTPLSPAAIGVLKTAPKFVLPDGPSYVFPNIRAGKTTPISQEVLTKAIALLHKKQKAIDGIGWVDPNILTNQGVPRRVCAHGLARATFKTWANDAVGYGHAEFKESTLESCLDHRHEKYANAYDREQAMGDMKRVFDAWGEYCCSKLDDRQKKILGL